MIALLAVMFVVVGFVGLFGSLGFMLLVADDKIAIPGTGRAKEHNASRDLRIAEIRHAKTQHDLEVLALEDARLNKALEMRNEGRYND